MSEIRYANDLVLTELARKIRKTEKSMQWHLTDGYLDAAWVCAHRMQGTLEALKERLNRIKWPDGGQNEAEKRSEDHQPDSSDGVGNQNR